MGFDGRSLRPQRRHVLWGMGAESAARGLTCNKLIEGLRARVLRIALVSPRWLFLVKDTEMHGLRRWRRKSSDTVFWAKTTLETIFAEAT